MRYVGEHEKMPDDDTRRNVLLDFIEVVFHGGDTLLGADVHRGVFSAQTSKIFSGQDLYNPPDTLYSLTGDGKGPGSDYWAAAHGGEFKDDGRGK